ncbi:nucleoside/nucleotide kinase family protein [Naumannella halotolerans]|uniref:nucleoside/nucleotide kinase family protein n=1 Tax=Naumannella halotolerans TaxID=993414 RepID=UPI001FBB2C2B|nr:nucleoside/nucleotide kinase family protein [Naumannella halotolerans]
MPEQPATIRTFGEAMERARGLIGRTQRRILGITGVPAAGKSTLAEALVAVLAQEYGRRVAHLPMDGFHLADVELARLGRLDGKGAPDTFDTHGFASLLERVRTEQDVIIYAPAFERELEQPVAGAIPIHPEAELIITEGNYLLLDEPGWCRSRAAIDQVWYCEVDETLRRQRLLARHLRYGKELAQAEAWIAAVDDPNAAAVAAVAATADLRVAAEVITDAGRRTGR